MKNVLKRIRAFTLIMVLALTLTAQSFVETEAAETVPAKPKISVEVSLDCITVSIKKTENADGYRIYIKGKDGNKYSVSVNVKDSGARKTTYTIDGLKDGEYRVRAKAYSGSVYSKYSSSKNVVVDTKDGLSLWNDDAPLKKELISYLKAVTDETSADYIPVENRIAVFDLDGTLFCETDPNYFDHMLLLHRVTEDPDYKDKASDFERETAEKIIEMNETGTEAKGLPVDHGTSVATAFAGMTQDEFIEYIQKFKELPMPGYEGMNRGDGWYKPMLEVVELLQANDFTVYIVSGTDRYIVRGLIYNSPLDIPNRQIIGSDETLISSGQNGTDGLDYVFKDGEKVVLGGGFVVKNLKMNKVTAIVREIGVQPVLSFGNSSGDSSMAEYTTSNNKYKSLAFMLCCDDTERENGNAGKAEKMYDMCEEFDWIPVSMKNDWKTIYGDGVVRKSQADESDIAA